MSQLSYDRLSDEALASGLAALPGWSLSGDMITRSFSFSSYSSGLVFAVAVGHAADTLNHHPDLLIGYGKVTVSMTTHDSGGLTSYDLELARRVSAIFGA